MKPPVVTKTSGSHTGAVRNLNTVKQLINELQMWGYDELPRDVANAFHECLYELNALLVTGWTEVDEEKLTLERDGDLLCGLHGGAPVKAFEISAFPTPIGGGRNRAGLACRSQGRCIRRCPYTARPLSETMRPQKNRLRDSEQRLM